MTYETYMVSKASYLLAYSLSISVSICLSLSLSASVGWSPVSLLKIVVASGYDVAFGSSR